jgi:tripartite-type tricarboxylate transporter receptor subunit TctC
MAILRRRFLQIATGALGSRLAYNAAWAEEYPSRSVRLLVGFPDGGPVDIAGRTIGAWLSNRFGQAFIVENRPGEAATSPRARWSKLPRMATRCSYAAR